MASITSFIDGQIAFSSAIIAFGGAAIPITMFLDRNLSDEWRAKISAALKTGRLRQGFGEGPMLPAWRTIAETISRFAGELFQTRGVSSFVRASIILSLTIIFASFGYLYLRGDETARAEIQKLFSSNRTFLFSFIMPLVFTLIIDLIAAFQTIVFLRMIGKCRSFAQGFVLAYSNLLASIGLFSLLFPLVIVLLLLAENQITHKGTIALQPVMTSQLIQSKDFASILIFGQPVKDAAIKQSMTLWNIESSAFKGGEKKGSTRHTLTVLTSKDFQANELLPFIHEAFKIAAGQRIKILNIETRSGGFFNLPSSELQLEVHNLFDGVPVSALYREAFSQTNLFGTNSLELVRGNLLPVGTEGANSALTVDILTDEALLKEFDTAFKCDGSLSRLHVEHSSDVSQILGKCGVWAAVGTSLVLVDAAQVANLTSSNLVVTPFALSSLTVTLTVYMLVLTVTYAFLVRWLVPRLFSVDIIKIENIPLTVSAVLVWAFFFLPLGILIKLLGS